MGLLNDAILEYNAKKEYDQKCIDEAFKERYMYALWRKHLKNQKNVLKM